MRVGPWCEGGGLVAQTTALRCARNREGRAPGAAQDGRSGGEGLGGSGPEHVPRLATRTLADGEVLDGSKHNYTLTFAADQLPPARAFWSLTMYDGASQFLVDNPIKRYLINSPMLPGLKRGANGSLTLYIQKDSPGGDREANWLPAPDGPIYLVLRLYGPRQSALSGEWKNPPLVRIY